MGLFSKIFGKKSDAERVEKETENQNLHGASDLETLQKIFSEFRAKTMRPIVKISPYQGETTPTSSKFGGTPYFSRDLDFPLGKAYEGENQPLKLLAQLNFAEIPHLEGYPDHGLLQIFVFPDDLYGADFDDETAQKNFRIFYHEKLDLPALEDIPEPVTDENYMPFTSEFALKFELGQMPMTSNDFRFDETFLKIYKRYFETEKEGVWTVMDEWADAQPFEDFCDTLYGGGHRMGGYAEFTQTDPRYYGEALKNHTELLLQIDSGQAENVEGLAGQIMWGDVGVANFLIRPDSLKACDFSDVAYNWDCG